MSSHDLNSFWTSVSSSGKISTFLYAVRTTVFGRWPHENAFY